MSLHKEIDEDEFIPEFPIEEDKTSLEKRKKLKKMLEEKQEAKRIREELDEYEDDEFDWSDFNKSPRP